MRLKHILEQIDNLQARLTRLYDLDQLWLTEGPKHIEVHSLRVKPDNQGQGIGAQVIDQIKNYAAKTNKRVILFAEPDKGKKTALDRFYKSHGFKKPGRSRDYSLPKHTHMWRP